MSLRNSVGGVFFYRLLDRVLPWMQRHVTSPNQLTLLGVAIAATVPFGFYFSPLAGMILMVLSGLADVADGSLARSSGAQSEYGAFFDSTLDRFSDFFYLMGFWVLFWPRGEAIPAGVLVGAAFLFTVLISYTKARAEGLGRTCNVGLMERGFRVLYLIAWALLLALAPGARGDVLWIGLVLFCLLTLVTVIQRILHVRAQLMK